MWCLLPSLFPPGAAERHVEPERVTGGEAGSLEGAEVVARAARATSSTRTEQQRLLLLHRSLLFIHLLDTLARHALHLWTSRRSPFHLAGRFGLNMSLPPVVIATAQAAVLSMTSNLIAQSLTAYRAHVSRVL